MTRKRNSSWISISIVLSLILLAGMTVPNNASASSQLVFTSTADFDSGNKSTSTGFGTWNSSKAAMPLNTADSASAVNGGSIYVIGGFGNSSSSDVRTQNLRYTPATNSWQIRADVPSARWGMAAASWKNRIYVFAGRDSVGGIQTVDYYNVDTNAWTARADAPTGLDDGGPCAVPYGSDSIFVILNTRIFRYSVSGDSYSEMTAMGSNPGTFANCSIVGHFLYVMGGNQQTLLVHRYSIDADTWDDSFDETPYNQLGGISNIVIDGVIYYGFGYDNVDTFFDKMYSYVPGGAWTKLTEGRHGRDGVSFGVVSDRIYVIAGRDLNVPVGITYNEEFRPFINDGSNGVDTFSDNILTPGNAFILSNTRYDSFATSDPDASTFKWNRIFVSTRNDGNAYSIASNHVNLKWDSQPSSETTMEFSEKAVTGDFDVRVSSTRVGSSGAFILAGFKKQAFYAAPGQDGVFYYWISPTTLDAFTVSGGSLTQIGSASTAPATTTWLRIARVGNVFTWYYSSDGVSWTTDESTTFSVTTTLFPNFGVEHVPNAAAEWNVNVYYLPVGTVGYRPTGTWSIPMQTTDEVVSNVTVTFDSAINPALGIQSVAIVLRNGRVVYSAGPFTATINGDNVRKIVIPASLRNEPYGQDWTVRLTLFGDTTFSVIVKDVTVDTVAPANIVRFEQMINGMEVFLFLAILVIAVIGAIWIRSQIA